MRQVAIVNASFARTYFGTADVVGKGFVPYDMGSTTPWTIVGVAGDTRKLSALRRRYHRLHPIRADSKHTVILGPNLASG